MTYFNRVSKYAFFRLIHLVIIISLCANYTVWPARDAYAQSAFNLPAPGTMIMASPSFVPAIIKGITLYPENPLKFDFIVDPGDDNLKGDALRKEANKLIKYFMASLTIPEDEMWVNLSPYEKDRIIANGLSQTELGRDLLAQDYVLKQLTASFMYPEEDLGEKFWQKVYTKAQATYGTSEIPMNTFNKIWIIPEKANVYVNGNNVFVVNNHLKVMLEEDYLALESNLGHSRHGVGNIPKDQVKEINDVSSDVVREIVIPAIEKEVNEGKNFANLRQIFNSMILATWYKHNLEKSLLNQVYANKNKTEGIDLEDKQVTEKIYKSYVEAFKKGVYDYIKEDYDETTQELIPRKYFSGGIEGPQRIGTRFITSNEGRILNGRESIISVEFSNIEHDILHQEARIRETLEQRYRRQQLAEDKAINEIKKEISEARSKNMDLDVKPDEITDDGIRIFIDQFEFNHAGRDKRVIYVRSKREAAHKLRELRLWEKFIIDHTDMNYDEAKRIGMGKYLINWANNAQEKSIRLERQNELIRTYYTIFAEGLKVDGRNKEAEEIISNISRLESPLKEPLDSFSFDFFIAGPGPQQRDDIDKIRKTAMEAEDVETFMRIIVEDRIRRGLLTTDKTFYLTGVYDFLGRMEPIKPTIEDIDRKIAEGKKLVSEIFADGTSRLRFFEFALSYQYFLYT